MFAGYNKLTVGIHNITEHVFYAFRFYVDPILSVDLHKSVYFKTPLTTRGGVTQY